MIELEQFLQTPIGTLLLTSRDNRLGGITILSAGTATTASPAAAAGSAGDGASVLEQAATQLGEYFAGGRRVFQLPCDLSGLPRFTRLVLEVLQTVPFGATVTYGELAQRAGAPRAARAVGRALAVNPLPIVIPCHRVVAANGHLGGYSGGAGPATKAWLLAFEAGNRQSS